MFPQDKYNHWSWRAWRAYVRARDYVRALRQTPSGWYCHEPECKHRINDLWDDIGFFVGEHGAYCTRHNDKYPPGDR